MTATIAATAIVAESAAIGDGTRIWHHVQVREGARIGRECIVGKDAFIDAGVVVGDRCKIQNAALLYHGVTLADGVFVGPRVTFTNDLAPRAINPDGTPKGEADWVVTPTRVLEGASLGAASTIVCGVTIGRWAMVAAGAVVTRNVADHALVMGAPARQVGWVGEAGVRLVAEGGAWRCPATGTTYQLPPLPMVHGGHQPPSMADSAENGR